jgi:hypothetical protein
MKHDFRFGESAPRFRPMTRYRVLVSAMQHNNGKRLTFA